jgi:ABC-type lipoprotein release transport system permease subunit
VNYTAGADPSAFRDRAADVLSLDEEDFLPASLPVDLVNFGGADAAPLVVASLMAVVATATLVHTLAVAATRRRHDLGVLRVLGFTQRQSLATVAWQATVLVVTALSLAVPVGIASGRVAWLGFADQLGVVPSPVVPGLAVLAVVGTSLAVAQLAAAAPAWRAARTSATTALRVE